MQISCGVDALAKLIRKSIVCGLGPVLFSVLLGAVAMAQGGPLVLEREGRVISLVPYALNIVRVTISTDKAAATGDPGYGIVAKPSSEGWTHERDGQGNDVFRSAEMMVHVATGDLPPDKLPQPMPLDELNRQLREKYFGGGAGGTPRRGPHNDAMLVTTANGKVLLQMRTWMMLPERAEVTESDAADKGFHRAAATFDSLADEHYYGLGQQQKGWMDLRDHEIRCWHDYGAIGGEDVCVPFMVSSRGYGLVWDNPSKTTIDLGFNGRNVWSSEVGDRVSYFVIAGESSDKIYEGLSAADGRHTHAAESGVRLHPEQGDLLGAGTDN